MVLLSLALCSRRYWRWALGCHWFRRWVYPLGARTITSTSLDTYGTTWTLASAVVRSLPPRSRSLAFDEPVPYRTGMA
jgi:hypothetical protein